MHWKKLIGTLLILVFALGCQKDKAVFFPEETQPVPVYKNYSQLKVGNYWIYQRFEIDGEGKATPTSVYDSCYVEKDTLINGNIYFKLYQPPYPSNYSPYLFVRDSLHFTITDRGMILFSSEDFSTTFHEYYFIIYPDNEADTVAHVSKLMTDKDHPYFTPSGTHITSNFRITFDFYPKYSQAGTPRYAHTRYAENVGMVTQTLPFFVFIPSSYERRLVRYKVN
jgi:hypothetical protein